MNVNRISGLASGMDTDALIKKLMDAQRAPVDKLMQQKQTLEWQRDDYRALNMKILDFRTNAFDMKLLSNYSAKKASSNHEEIITASPTASAVDGIYELEVQQLAEGSRLTSGGPVGATGMDDKIGNLRTSKPTTGGSLLRIAGEKGTATIVVNNADTIADFVSNFNSQTANTGVRVTYDSNLDHFFFSSVNTGKAAKVELNATDLTTGASDNGFLTDALRLSTTTTNLTGETVTGAAFMTTPPQAPDLDKPIDGSLTSTQLLRINYKGQDYDFAINNTAKIGLLIDSINASGLKAAGITAGLDATTGKLTFTGLSGGNKIQFTDQTADATDVVAHLGLPSSPQGGPTVAGDVAYLKQPPDFVDRNKKIDPSMTATETFKVTFDGKDYSFDITAASSIGSLIDQINISDLGKKGVTARLDGTTGKLILTSPDNTKHLSFSDADNNSSTGVLKALGLTAGSNVGTSFSYDQSEIDGKDAIVFFNGVRGEYASNTISIAGINFTAKTAVVGTKANIVVTQDVDTVFNKIKGFVDKYNELIDAVNKKISERKDRQYQPLTDAQRSSMKDDQIKQWEEKAKTGTLSNDPLLSNGLNQFRRSLSDSISGLPTGQLKSLADIGISNVIMIGTSVSGSFQDSGKLYIDEAKLKAAIADKPEEIAKLFNADDGDAKSSGGDGIAVRLYDRASALFSQISEKAGVDTSLTTDYLLGKEMNDIDTRTNALNDRLKQIEDRYYKQFTAMETYLNQMNAQSSWLAQQLGAAGGG